MYRRLSDLSAAGLSVCTEGQAKRAACYASAARCTPLWSKGRGREGQQPREGRQRFRCRHASTAGCVPPTVLQSPSHLRTSSGIGAGGREVDELAGTIAARATELREVQGKGARAQKKRTLAVLVEALQAAGVSRLRSAVPATERSVQAWFRQVRPHSVLPVWDR